MKVPVIKKLVEQFSLAELSAAEEALLNEEKPDIDISGEDEGEKLTHAYAAVIIKRCTLCHCPAKLYLEGAAVNKLKTEKGGLTEATFLH